MPRDTQYYGPHPSWGHAGLPVRMGIMTPSASKALRCSLRTGRQTGARASPRAELDTFCQKHSFTQ